MKTFVQKTKIEDRQELNEAHLPLQEAQASRPVFLNPALNTNLQASALPLNNNTCDTLHSYLKDSLENPSQLVIPITSIPANKKKKKKQKRPKKGLLRRRSCSCQWCGGISAFEEKHQDIVTHLKKFEGLKSSYEDLTYSPRGTLGENIRPKSPCTMRKESELALSLVKSYIKAESLDQVEVPIKENVIENEENVIQEEPLKMVIVTEPETKEEPARAVENENKRIVKTPLRLKSLDYLMPYYLKPTDQLKKVMETSVNLDQDTSVNIPDAGSPLLFKKQNIISKEILRQFKPKKQPYLTPIKLQKNIISSSNYFSKKSSKKKKRDNSLESLPILRYHASQNNSTSLTPLPSVTPHQHSSKALQALVRTGSISTPFSNEKLRQLVTPMTLASSVDKAQNRTQNKFDCSLKELDQERRSPTLSEILPSKSGFVPIGIRLDSNEEIRSSIFGSPNNLFLQVSSQIKQKYVSPTVEIKKVDDILRVGRTKTLNIYAEEKGDLVLKSSGTVKYSGSYKGGLTRNVSLETSPANRSDVKKGENEVDKSFNGKDKRANIKSNIRVRIKGVNSPNNNGQSFSGNQSLLLRAPFK